MSQERTRRKQQTRFLKLLSKQRAEGFSFRLRDQRYELHHETRTHTFDAQLVGLMRTKGYAIMRGSRLKITDKGTKSLIDGTTPDGKTIEDKSIVQTQAHESRTPEVNPNESPLLRLFTRKTKNGRPYLSTEQFHAGERLRQDFERGQLQPRMTAALETHVTGSGKSGWKGNGSDLSDFSIDARTRVSEAVRLLGPELGGVALDICCFLKGFEAVERERQWPPRSAKLMLRTALSLLSVHYGFVSPATNRKAEMTHWGSEEYRPSIGI